MARGGAPKKRVGKDTALNWWRDGCDSVNASDTDLQIGVFLALLQDDAKSH